MNHLNNLPLKTYMKEYLKSIFSLDTKALSVFRILFALLVLVDIWTRLYSFDAFLGSSSIMPLDILLEHHYEETFWSPYAITENIWITLALIAWEIFAAVCLLIWRKTRYAIIAVWFFIASVHANNPMILNWWDTVMRLILFWAMFLPLHHRYSIDSKNIKNKDKPTHILSMWSAWFICQLFIIYIFSFLIKDHPSRASDFDATYLALSLDSFRTWLWDILYTKYEFLKFMTWFVYLLEWWGWIFFLVPWKNNVFRTWILGIYCLFHIWLWTTMYLWLFPWIMIWTLIALLPWHHLEVEETKNKRDTSMHIWTQVFLACVLIYIICWNIRTLDFDKHSQRFPYEINRIWFTLRIEQHWNMFAPFPTRDDWWFEIIWMQNNWDDILINSPRIWIQYWKNPWANDRHYTNEKRHKIYSNMRIKSWIYMREPFLKWVCTRIENQDISRLDMYFIKERTLDNYETKDTERVHLARAECN